MNEERENDSRAWLDPLVKVYWDSFKKRNTFWDYGDDPSFFCSNYFIGEPRGVSWGVCRPDVRREIRLNDVVIFFCTSQDKGDKKIWRYYLTGVGLVSEVIDRYKQYDYLADKGYSKYLNILIKRENGLLVHSERFFPPHENWQERARSPYIIFDTDRSKFNLENPRLVATYDGTVPEKWLSAEDPIVSEIENLLFVDQKIDRRLRTGTGQNAHTKLNLSKKSINEINETNLIEELKNLI